uniref:Uncharacterized protein n=1 Tax=Nelumbo nucifera TaxID=4432 RepID=A0A822ZSM5_NELNU|nr:TPA_asm: hypothetical protein HUJ06_017437 [Nelumbo nucifera]
MLGLGASFLCQFMGMAGIGGGKSFLAFTRQQGISSIEQILQSLLQDRHVANAWTWVSQSLGCLPAPTKPIPFLSEEKITSASA